MGLSKSIFEYATTQEVFLLDDNHNHANIFFELMHYIDAKLFGGLYVCCV
jgi:hypothetical protein